MRQTRSDRIGRRPFLRAAGVAAVGPLLLPRLARGGPRRRPNILWITCEDISPDLGCYGDAHATTPRLDRLAAQGCRYTGAFSISGVCGLPSRSALITGMYPTTIGSHHMRCKAVPPPSVRCFTEYSAHAAGYYCTNRSKTDYQFAPPVTAWDVCGPKGHWRGREKDQPFFAVINFTSTHESQLWKIDGNLAHDPAKLELPPYYPDTPIVRRNWARYYDVISRMDGQVGAVLDQLEADGLADETIVFFYSDHGRGLPRAKRWIYDSGLHVPLLIRWPGTLQPGSVDERLVSFVDFAPTVLSLAGLPVPEHMQGRAFLGDAAGPPRDCIFAARDRMDETYDIIRCVRDRQFKYIRNFEPDKPYAQPIEYMDRMPMLQEMRRLNAEGKLEGPEKLFFRQTKPVEELYDLTADPHEIHDLAASPDHQDVLGRMRGLLETWRKDTHDLGLIPEAELRRRGLPAGHPGNTAPVTVQPDGGTFDGPVTVTLSCPTEGASIACTTDPAPKPHWKLYSGPIRLDHAATLRAKACRLGWKDSPVAAATFQTAGK